MGDAEVVRLYLKPLERDALYNLRLLLQISSYFTADVGPEALKQRSVVAPKPYTL